MRAHSPRRRVLALITAIASAALALTACAPDRTVEISAPVQVDAALPDETRAALEQAVTDAMVATGSSGAIVGVWVPWSGTLVTGLGTESAEDGTPVTADMRFRVTDMTRAMACDALYALDAQGTVSLDDSVAAYVTGVPDLEDVSLLELCNGTSGIGSYAGQLQSMWLTNPERVWNPRELASFGLGLKRVAEPGVAWRDSDAGYVLLGLALERAAGMSASELMSDYVFEPLSLEDTSLPEPGADWTDGIPVLTGLHSTKDADGVMNCTTPADVTDLSTSTGFTDSGVVSTIEDLGRYTLALATGALTGEDSPSRWTGPLAPGDTAPSWFTTTGGAFQAGSLIGQYGAVPGYQTAAFADPTTGMTIAVVLNNSGAGSRPISYLAWELAAIASKAPAASGETAPEFGLPWTAEQFHEEIATAAICAPADQ